MTEPIAGTALITGGTEGVGAAYAAELARRGHDIILVARTKDRLDQAAATLTAETGRTVSVLAADLSTTAGIRAVEERLADDTSIDIVVNNAGSAAFGPLAAADPDQLEQLITLNVTAATRIAAAAAKAFTARDRGTIVNLSSALALNVLPVTAVYSATKAYALTLTQGLALEFAGTGVRVQAVLPGALRTSIWDGSGIELSDLPEQAIMPVADAVRAALAGLEAGELVSIVSLPDNEVWLAYERARQQLIPHVSRSTPAERYAA